jgi:putative membrane protein
VIVKILQGAAIGFAFILPGLNGGTVILLLGFYRKFLQDLSRFNLRPYIPHLLGGTAAAYAGVQIISYLMSHYNDLLKAFLLGMLVASIRVVMAQERKLEIRPLPLLLGAAGLMMAWFIFGEPSTGLTVLPPGSLFHFFLGGATASATMLLPGVSGSAVLVIFNLYDDVIRAVNQLQWLNLACFAGGIIAGLFGLARILSALYRRHSAAITFLLTGLILGSTRALLPVKVNYAVAATAMAGVLLVTLLSVHPTRKQFKNPSVK